MIKVVLILFAVCIIFACFNINDDISFDEGEVNQRNKSYDRVCSLQKRKNNGEKLSFLNSIHLKVFKYSLLKYLKNGDWITYSQVNFASLCGYEEMISKDRIIESKMRLVKDNDFWIYKCIPEEIKPY